MEDFIKVFEFAIFVIAPITLLCLLLYISLGGGKLSGIEYRFRRATFPAEYQKVNEEISVFKNKHSTFVHILLFKKKIDYMDSISYERGWVRQEAST